MSKFRDIFKVLTSYFDLCIFSYIFFHNCFNVENIAWNHSLSPVAEEKHLQSAVLNVKYIFLSHSPATNTLNNSPWSGLLLAVRVNFGLVLEGLRLCGSRSHPRAPPVWNSTAAGARLPLTLILTLLLAAPFLTSLFFH